MKLSLFSGTNFQVGLGVEMNWELCKYLIFNNLSVFHFF